VVERTAEKVKAPCAGIIVIGRDLLSGFPGDAVRKYVAGGLMERGFRVDRFSIIRADEKALEELLLKGLESPETDILIVVGGIEEDSGDMAARAAARVTGRRLIVSDEILGHMRIALHKGGLEMTHTGERLALVPQKAKVLKNPAGPVCGFMLEERGKPVFFIPGSPDSIRAMSKESIFPLLSKGGAGENLICSRRFHTFGLREDRIKALLAEAIPPAEAVEIAYDCAHEETTVRISVTGAKGEKKLEGLANRVRERLGDSIFAENGGTMEETVGNLLRLKRANLATAESCTGGGIGNRITDVPGSSDYFEMGVITYSNEAKTKLLGVQPSLIEKKGAVSSEVALLMAQGVRRLGRTTFGLAVTGIAGPGGGSREKPVGTVFIAFSSEEESKFEKHNFEGSREEIKKLTAQAALDLLRRELIRR